MIRSCALRLLVLALLLAGVSPALFGDIIPIDFEGLSDSTFITTQFPGVVFSNAITLTAGISLNEFDFPPRSGVNVASDSGGAITISFSSPSLDFLGYFTYAVPVTLQGFGASNNLLASVSSLFSTNTLSGGDPGSSPNELLEMTSALGFSKVVITGDPAGGSFTLDDVVITTGQVSSVPEPLSAVSTALSLLLLAGIRRR